MRKALSALVFLLATPVWAYTINFTNPSEDRAYQRPAQTAEIVVMVSPKPTPLHTLLISVDGQVVATNQNTVNLASLDYTPGEHIVTVDLQGETGRVIASASRKIYFIQNTTLIKQKREEAAAQAAYDALPWYKKIKIKLTQDTVQLSK